MLKKEVEKEAIKIEDILSRIKEEDEKINIRITERNILREEFDDLCNKVRQLTVRFHLSCHDGCLSHVA